MKRAFGVEIEACARCGGKLAIIASIGKPEVIAKILAHLERTAANQYQPELPLGARAPPSLEGGLNFLSVRLLVNVIDMPIKCPVAPLDNAFTKPVAAATLHDLLTNKGVELVTEFNTGSVESSGDGPWKLIGYDGREFEFDLAVVAPLHSSAAYVGRSPGLGDAMNLVPTDIATLQTKVRPNVFAVGDATNLPASKAGSVTHFEGEILVDNIVRFLEGREFDETCDGHANCFIETGFGKALLIDFKRPAAQGPCSIRTRPCRPGEALLRTLARRDVVEDRQRVVHELFVVLAHREVAEALHDLTGGTLDAPPGLLGPRHGHEVVFPG